MASAKVTLVRVKRKRKDESIDAFWLEQQSPLKRQTLELKNLLLEESQASTSAASTCAATKLLFRRVETIQVADIGNVSLAKSLLEKLERKDKQEARRSDFKKQNKPGTSTARQQHKVAAQSARYQQVWDHRREDAMHHHFHLYDVVREEGDDASDMEMLKKFMPLLKECIPDEYERIKKTDEFVYDVYAQEQCEDEDIDDELLSTVRVSNELDYGYGNEKDSDYDSEDSNREDHPDNDYPDDEDEDEEADEEADEEEDSDADQDESDGEDTEDQNGEDDKRWQMRR